MGDLPYLIQFSGKTKKLQKKNNNFSWILVQRQYTCGSSRQIQQIYPTEVFNA